ncbi:hypothetical protein LVX13_16610, partial [Streptomyces albulus]|uniref:hypothetical protein n=1 Tax=Streptomyces noursei TaxID=1971 RepID=UPI001F35999B
MDTGSAICVTWKRRKPNYFDRLPDGPSSALPEMSPERPDYEPSGKAAKVVDTPKGKSFRQEFGA